MPPSPPQPRRQLTIAMIKRREKLESCFFDLLERKKEHYAALHQVEHDDEIMESTRNSRLEALNKKIEAMEVKMSGYRDEIDEIDVILIERGYMVEPCDGVIGRLCGS
ncbi:hypothetical protein HOY80DRAFT_1040153 [Tuber brumale]|nr:hypothetical protein HOY80DRAFT_1040153 [Tuber brumale]